MFQTVCFFFSLRFLNPRSIEILVLNYHLLSVYRNYKLFTASCHLHKKRLLYNFGKPLAMPLSWLAHCPVTKATFKRLHSDVVFKCHGHLQHPQSLHLKQETR